MSTNFDVHDGRPLPAAHLPRDPDDALVPTAGSDPTCPAITDLVDRPLPDEPLVHVVCPHCGSSSSRLLMHGCDRLFGLPGWYRVVECASCALRYVNPRPTADALLRHYPREYPPVRVPDGRPSLGRRLAEALLQLRWLGYIRTVERVTGRIPSEARVVDVGSGLNDLLVCLERMRGVRGLAVEFNPAVADYIESRLRMPVYRGTLIQANLDTASADLITMNEYLEHEPDPRSVLLEARRISREGAHLVVEVPKMDGGPARLFGSCWSQLDVPRHLAFYTPETLEKMLAACRYRLLYVKPFGAPFSVGISILQALGLKKLGRMTALDVLLIALAGAPLLPFYPWMHEFMLVVARAE